MTEQEIKALKSIIERTGRAPYWEGSCYVAETASGYIEGDMYFDSAVLEVPLSEIPVDQMKLVDVEDADTLISEHLEAMKFAGVPV